MIPLQINNKKYARNMETYKSEPVTLNNLLPVTCALKIQ